MKLSSEQYQQILNSITNKTVDLSFIRELEVEDIIHYAKENHPKIYDSLDEETKENFENMIKYKFRKLN